LIEILSKAKYTADLSAEEKAQLDTIMESLATNTLFAPDVDHMMKDAVSRVALWRSWAPGRGGGCDWSAVTVG
jgi:hypothetical protein